MPSRIRPALVGLGVFFVVLAASLRFYAAPRIVTAPLDYYQSTRLQGRHASYYDAAAKRMRRDVTLGAVSTVRGDPRATAGRDGVAVWDTSTDIFDRDRDRRLEMRNDRIAFDRRTSRLVGCCGSGAPGSGARGSGGGETAGYGLLFPVGDVRRTGYPFRDRDTGLVRLNRFDGTEDVHGLAAYRFVQTIPETKVAGARPTVPGDLLGRDGGKERQVDRYVSATVTTWVDPRTGIPVKTRRDLTWTGREPGVGRGVTLARADLVTVAADQRRLVGMADGYAFRFTLVRTSGPAAALAAGVLLLLVAAWTVRASSESL